MQNLKSNLFLIYFILLGTNTLQHAVKIINEVFSYCFTRYQYIDEAILKSLIPELPCSKLMQNLILQPDRTSYISKTAKTFLQSKSYLDIYNYVFMIETVFNKGVSNLISDMKQEKKKGQKSLNEFYIKTSRGFVEVGYNMLLISKKLEQEIVSVATQAK